MKAVLISNKPKWCELIAIRKKFWELRKTKPKLKPPFKVYIYETKEKAFADIWIYGRTKDGIRYKFVHRIGKVIGEFICDEIREVYQCNSGWVAENACVMRNEFFNYLGIPQDTHFGYDKKAYAWHINDLKIYDKPKELDEFKTFCRDAYCQDDCGTPTWFCKDGYGSCAVKDKELAYSYNDECIYFDCPTYGDCCEYEDFAYCLCKGIKPLTRPPQSWCYVEELKDD